VDGTSLFLLYSFCVSSVFRPRPIIVPVKIYTRTGDAGETGLFDGTRVPKSDPRVAAYGDIDELNAWLGLARSELAAGGGATTALALPDLLERLQRDLFALGARLADPRHKIADRVTKAVIGAEQIAQLENWIDALEEELQPLRRFILPGGSRAGATLHVARTVCRRAERAMVALGTVEGELLTYVNRVSDLLFVMARVANHRQGTPEVEW
jgi:cob(I)alamin adenosyltransferase